MVLQLVLPENALRGMPQGLQNSSSPNFSVTDIPSNEYYTYSKYTQGSLSDFEPVIGGRCFDCYRLLLALTIFRLCRPRVSYYHKSWVVLWTKPWLLPKLAAFKVFLWIPTIQTYVHSKIKFTIILTTIFQPPVLSVMGMEVKIETVTCIPSSHLDSKKASTARQVCIAKVQARMDITLHLLQAKKNSTCSSTK